MEDKKTYVIEDVTTDEIIGVLITDKNSSEVCDLIVKSNQLAGEDGILKQTTAFKSLLSEEDIFTEGVLVYYM